MFASTVWSEEHALEWGIALNMQIEERCEPTSRQPEKYHEPDLSAIWHAWVR
jgi:hypothetical protein